jgi:hypothetical protein
VPTFAAPDPNLPAASAGTAVEQNNVATKAIPATFVVLFMMRPLLRVGASPPLTYNTNGRDESVQRQVELFVAARRREPTREGRLPRKPLSFRIQPQVAARP